METFFNIRYEFDKAQVHDAISSRLLHPGSDYICVADGVILDNANRYPEYCSTVNNGMFAICDSSYVPLYIRWIYGLKREQYCGAHIFKDIVASRKYRMIFLGGSNKVLNGLKKQLKQMNPDVEAMQFVELPFLPVEKFDYPAIAETIHEDGAEIIWVSLGAPKQEMFMERLRPHLRHGVMIAVGAAFKFYSGVDVQRAPDWMVKHHAEFVHRILVEPKKQIRRCMGIVTSLPRVLTSEAIRKFRKSHPQPPYLALKAKRKS
jgi:N-acetylglucosaminyldiphosphoundecaprenol N-acetyl-beta-D-mannosaminyltransferase